MKKPTAKKPTDAGVKRIVRRLVQAGPTDWDTITLTIQDKFFISNWLTQVRRPMQAMIKAGQISRVRDIRHEIYQSGPRA